MRRRLPLVRSVVLAVGVVAAGLVLVLALSNRDRGSSDVPLYAPDFAGETLDGGRFDMAQQRGRWVVVNFFSTWCAQCVVEHPELQAFDVRHRDDPDVTLVSVVFNDDPDVVAEFFGNEGGDWPVVVQDTGQVAIGFGVTAVPETYLVRPDGIIAARFTGGVTETDLESQLMNTRAALQEAGG